MHRSLHILDRRPVYAGMTAILAPVADFGFMLAALHRRIHSRHWHAESHDPTCAAVKFGIFQYDVWGAASAGLDAAP
jgi:hypothetical protein